MEFSLNINRRTNHNLCAVQYLTVADWLQHETSTHQTTAFVALTATLWTMTPEPQFKQVVTFLTILSHPPQPGVHADQNMLYIVNSFFTLCII